MSRTLHTPCLDASRLQPALLLAVCLHVPLLALAGHHWQQAQAPATALSIALQASAAKTAPARQTNRPAAATTNRTPAPRPVDTSTPIPTPATGTAFTTAPAAQAPANDAPAVSVAAQNRATENSATTVPATAVNDYSGNNRAENDAAENDSSESKRWIVIKSRARVDYPLAMRKQGLQGTVIVRAHVQTDGSVAEVLIKQGSGHAALDNAALRSVRRWQFQPAGATNAAAWVEAPVRFLLNDRS